jgi:chromate reductase, NAD(P)H dehydrogenase (quinone)
MRVLAISGSLRSDSNSTALLRALREEAPAGVDVILWDGLKAIPPYDEDDDGPAAPATVTAFRELVREMDAVLIATPEYNSSIPGALKNALDWASRPLATNAFRNKPVAAISSSAGAFGGVWAAAELRKVLGAMGARVTDVELSVGHASTDVADDVRQSLREGLDVLLAQTGPVLVAA